MPCHRWGGQEEGGEDEVEEHVHVDIVIMFVMFEVVVSTYTLSVNSQTSGRGGMCRLKGGDGSMSGTSVTT